MGKPTFDPNQKFEIAQAADKPAFDPSKSFDVSSALQANKPESLNPFHFHLNAPTMAGTANAMIDSAPATGAMFGQSAGAAVGGLPGEIAGGGIGRVAGNMAKTAANDYQQGGLSQVLRPPTLEGLKQGAIQDASEFANGAAQAMGAKSFEAAMSGASDWLHSLAETKAFKAAGGMLKDFRAMFNKDPEKINDLGRTMIENGLVKAGDSVESIAQKADALRRQTGKQIGEVYDKVLDSITDPASGVDPHLAIQVQDAGFHPALQADEMKSMLAQKLKGVPGSTGALNKANTVIDELAVNGNNITPDHALDLKGHIDSMINWSKKSADLPIDQEALKEVRNYIQGKLNNQVSMLDGILGNNQSAELSRLNKLYGDVSTVSNIARDRALRNSANKAFGLTDTIAGAGGFSGGAGLAHAFGFTDPVTAGAIAAGTGAAAGAANHAAGKYGAALMSGGADAAGGLLSAGSRFSPALAASVAPAPPKMSTTIKSKSDLMQKMAN